MHGLTALGALQEVGTALRKPEALAARYRAEDFRSLATLIGVFLGNAVFGVVVYGAVMRLQQGASAMVESALKTSLAAGASWALSLPALYIFNSALGSNLRFGPTVLAASATVCFGSWAMLASVPITWFFGLALPALDTVINLIVFTGVGLCMCDVFIRVLRTLEPDRSSLLGYVWLALVGVIGAELFTLLGVFSF